MGEHASAFSNADLGDLIANLIQESGGLLVLFTESGCHVGEAIEPKLQALVHQRFPEMRQVVVSRNHVPELVAQLGVFAFPTVVTWFGGKETARFVRAFSLEAVAEAIERPYEILFG